MRIRAIALVSSPHVLIDIHKTTTRSCRGYLRMRESVVNPLMIDDDGRSIDRPRHVETVVLSAIHKIVFDVNHPCNNRHCLSCTIDRSIDIMQTDLSDPRCHDNHRSTIHLSARHVRTTTTTTTTDTRLASIDRQYDGHTCTYSNVHVFRGAR
jgi:hypothetical protein